MAKKKVEYPIVLNTGDKFNEKEISQGNCPCCGSEELEYGSMEVEGTQVSYEWTCMHCEATGYEVYNLDFAGHTINSEE